MKQITFDFVELSSGFENVENAIIWREDYQGEMTSRPGSGYDKFIKAVFDADEIAEHEKNGYCYTDLIERTTDKVIFDMKKGIYYKSVSGLIVKEA